MNLFGWHWGSGAPDQRDSSVGDALPRVRRMRENCTWPPLTPPPTVEQRKCRVDEARGHIHCTVEPLPPYEPLEKEATARIRWRIWLLFLIPLALVGAGMVALLITTTWTTAPGNASASAPGPLTFQLPTSPPYLSERYALWWATEAFAVYVGNTNGWVPVIQEERMTTIAPDGTRDVYLSRLPGDLNTGFIDFQRPGTT
ncbi:MAG: hypothetical protein L0Z53_04625, partial [Acidobacteriales bacterium]|nr:hypothetical protein [Terriglobales bacterium]